MPLVYEPYLDQTKRWPKSGYVILAQFDERSVVVYQAYRESIARHAVEHQRFGGEFSLSRMTWIKPNFLWMMYRSGWATKPDQERVLAVRLPRSAFDQIVAEAVPSSFDRRRYRTREEWQAAVQASDVRVQWDPDHDPAGQPLERRAIQLGLRRAAARRYASEWPLEIEDVTERVAAERPHALPSRWAELVTPREDAYPAVLPGEIDREDDSTN